MSYIYIYICGPVLRLSTHPPQWVGSPGSIPPSLLFASYWQHFCLPASHLLGTCYLLGAHILPQSTYVLHIVIYLCDMYPLPIYYLCTLTTLHVFNIAVPTIHSNDAMHTILIIPIIHTTYTIHMKHNYHLPCIQYQTYMPYIPYLPYIGHMPYPS